MSVFLINDSSFPPLLVSLHVMKCWYNALIDHLCLPWEKKDTIFYADCYSTVR